MSDSNNRLFHYLGFKDVIWIPESDLKNYPDAHTVVYEPREKFLIQHAIHGCWSLGIYYPTNKTKVLGIYWMKVIVIKGA